MSINELNEILRGIPAEKMGEIEIEYLDTMETGKGPGDDFCKPYEIRLVAEEVDGGYSYKLRLL